MRGSLSKCAQQSQCNCCRCDKDDKGIARDNKCTFGATSVELEVEFLISRIREAFCNGTSREKRAGLFSRNIFSIFFYIGLNLACVKKYIILEVTSKIERYLW